MALFEIQQEVLCTWLWDNKDKNMTNIQVLMNNIQEKYNYSESQMIQIRKKLTANFIPAFRRQWITVNRTQTLFKKKFKHFLDKNFEVLCVDSTSTDSRNRPELRKSSQSNVFDSTTSKRMRSSTSKGRPRSLYENSSDRTKRRRIQELRSSYNKKELLKAALPINDECVKVVTTEKKIDIVTGSLAMYMDLHLTKAKYENLRSYHQALFGDKEYPTYATLMSAKKACYPDMIDVTERGASIDLQSLLDHTTSRIILSVENEKREKFNGQKLVLYSKWGMDGASGQQTFKQKWSEQNPIVCNENSDKEVPSGVDVPLDESVFIISFVPLEISSKNDILWKNERPSSVRYCRPIKFQFIKETSVNTRKEYNLYMKKISELVPTTVTIGENTYNVSYDMKCTMIDGKVCNVLTDQKSSTSCNICGASPNQMNNLELIKNMKCKEENYKFGLSTLHCWIRFMECLLHVSYNIDFKNSSARGENKNLKEIRKKRIQSDLKSQLSITVDVVKRGYGTTNDGNTARRFFSEPEIVASILGLDENLIKKFANILQIMASGLEIDLEKFHEYATETAELFVKLYHWYKMPPSIHKVLIHGSHIMKAVNLPIGCLSEEAQEASNKIFKHARANNSRKCSRQANNVDVLHHLLISSDPIISKIRLQKEKKSKELSDEAQKLLKN